uniref:Alpha/beta hydrolase fold-3 domain-containing protein n=1 Tax=Oryza punctata TaxID=4537 RepID=A0A0E0JQW4_ORYPU
MTSLASPTSACTSPRSPPGGASPSSCSSTVAASATPTHPGSCTTTSTRASRAFPTVVVAVKLPLTPERHLPMHIDLVRCQRSRRPGGGAPLDGCRLLPGVPHRDSSGGNLVDARVHEDGEDSWAPLRVASGIPLQPGFVRATRSKSELEPRPDSMFFTLNMFNKFLAMALPEGVTKDHPYTCPMGLNALPLKFVPLPPLLVAIVEHDLIRDTTSSIAMRCAPPTRTWRCCSNRGQFLYVASICDFFLLKYKTLNYL